MPFNVCDKSGNHIGFIAAPYPQYLNVFMVALTTEKIADEKLQNAIKILLEGDYACYKNLSSTDFLKLLALKNLLNAIKKILKGTCLWMQIS